ASFAPSAAPTYTSSLFGTASWAVSASWAPAAGGGSNLVTGSLVPITSSYALTASDAEGPLYFLSSSLVNNAYPYWVQLGSGSYVFTLSPTSNILDGGLSASLVGTSSWASNAVTA